VELTLNERVLLANQYRMLKALDPDEAAHYELLCEILESGYVIEYSLISEHFVEEEYSRESCREVQDILDMHRMMMNTYRAMADKSGVDVDALDFKGFDGNDEGREYGYADFLINKQGRWAEFKKDDLNTHSSMLEHYRRMLESWDKSADKMHLTKDDLVRILASA
jgi:uncharacterized protein YfbU (UPF0304 family)